MRPMTCIGELFSLVVLLAPLGEDVASRRRFGYACVWAPLVLEGAGGRSREHVLSWEEVTEVAEILVLRTLLVTLLVTVAR